MLFEAPEQTWLEVERISDIVVLLQQVTAGDLSARLDITVPETDPYFGLYNALNEMIAALEQSRNESEGAQRALEEKLDVVNRQRDAIRQLSTPIIEVAQGVLCLPVVGVLDSSRASEMMDNLITRVAAKRTHCAIIDLTGIRVIDTGTADHLLRMAGAIHILGSRCILTGMSPEIAQTVVHMGISLEAVETCRSLREALRRERERSRAKSGGTRVG